MTLLFVETALCIVVPAFLGHALLGRPEHKGVALFLFLCAAAFLWLLLVDVAASAAGAITVTWRALIFRALMASGFLFLLSIYYGGYRSR